MFKSFWRKRNNDASENYKIILGMVMLANKKSFEWRNLIEDLAMNYKHTIDEPAGNHLATVFYIDEEMVSVAHVEAPIPNGDIEETAQYAYNWENAVEDLKDHESHIIVTVMRGRTNQVKRFRIFTHVICALLRTTDAIGVYKGNQSLLIPKEDYLAQAELMSKDYLPLNLWIYFGLRRTEGGRSGYTYGLKEFNKCEVEILDSQHSYSEIREVLFNTAHYVLDYDVTFKEGQTIGFTVEEKKPISLSTGKFVDGDSFKLNF